MRVSFKLTWGGGVQSVRGRGRGAAASEALGWEEPGLETGKD